MEIEKTNRMNALFEFYAALLTDKQMNYIELYYADDYSLAEIAEEFGVSRQAVYDNIKRTEKILEAYEMKLHMYSDYIVRSQIFDDIMKKYPYLVIEQDGKIEGYAYAHAFVGRAAYDWSSELTIYLDHNARKGGLGRRLYEELADRLKKMGILNLYACIGYPQVEDEYLTKNSAEFHAHLGFELVGTFHNCGYKFDRWYDMVWMEKIIGEPHAGQSAVKSYSEIKE